MPRWLRVIRGMIGTGLAFAAGASAAGSILGIIGVLLGKFSALDVVGAVARFLVLPPFLLGVVFSGILAIAARGRGFDRLSLPFVTALGAGGGLLYFLVIATNGAGAWSTTTAIVNFTLLTVLGAGSAAGILILARRTANSLKSGDGMPELREGDLDERLRRRETAEKARR